MKKSLRITATLLAISATLFMYACNNSGSTPAKTEAHENEGEGHHHVYSCPMHPEVTGKEGDTCSKCGMPLEHADEKKTYNH